MFAEKDYQSLDKTFLVLEMDVLCCCCSPAFIKQPYDLIKNLQNNNLFNYSLANLCGVQQSYKDSGEFPSVAANKSFCTRRNAGSKNTGEEDVK